MRRLLFAVFFLAAVVFSLGNVTADDRYELIQDGVLTVALYDNFFPYSYTDPENDQPKGIDYDIAAKLAEKLNLTYNPVLFTADENVDDDLRNMLWKGTSLERGRVTDMMMHVPSDNQLKARNTLVAFFAVYHTDSLRLLVKLNDEKPYRDLNDLADYQVGVEIDTLADFILLSHNGNSLTNNVAHYPGALQLITALKDGEVAAAAGTAAQMQAGQYLMDLNETHEIVTFDANHPLVRNWSVGIAVRENLRPLGYDVSELLDEMRVSGELSKIYAAYGLNYEFE